MGKNKLAAGLAQIPPCRAPLPKIPWTANGHAIVWSLISEMEKTENRKVLFGKKSDEVRKLLSLTGFPVNLSWPWAEKNSSPEHKISVCKHIAKVIVPGLYLRDASVAGEHVRAKIVT